MGGGRGEVEGEGGEWREVDGRGWRGWGRREERGEEGRWRGEKRGEGTEEK